MLFNYAVAISQTDYQNFIKKYFSIALTKDEFNIINRLRNALEHQSYNLVWEPDRKRKEKGKTTLFAMSEAQGQALLEKVDEKDDDETWVVNIDLLHKEIETSLQKIRAKAMTNKDMANTILEFTKNHEMHVVSKESFINYSKFKQAIKK